MIKRSFFALSKPRLTYDLLDPNPAAPETIPVPGTLTLLLPEPIDDTRLALIGKGDAVKKGEKLKLYDDSAVYAISPCAGTIDSVDAYTDNFGNKAAYILIKRNFSAGEDVAEFNPTEALDFAVSNLSQLPGAPPFMRIASAKKTVKTAVITGADTDLLSSTCQFICTAFTADMIEGAEILKRMTSISRVCITVPANLKAQTDFGGIQVLKTSATYPSAMPAMVMKDHLDTVLPPGNTPEDMGVCFIRAEALVSLAKAFRTQAHGFEKIIALVDKKGGQRRLKATIGTPLSKIFSQFDIKINEQDRIIIGGPMQGNATFTPHHPVTADMDMVIVQDKAAVAEISDTPCVNCGKCIRICPANIPVNLLVRYLEANQYEEAADKFALESCIECGLCAYVCTARIPLYQHIRLGKHELLALRAEA